MGIIKKYVSQGEDAVGFMDRFQFYEEPEFRDGIGMAYQSKL